MSTGVQVYKSTDGSAPVMSGQAGALTALLDAILVNGYGSKSAAGTGGAGAWAKSFTGTNKAVYRPSAGNRFYLRVQDDAAGTGGAKEGLLKAAESYSDVDTPTNAFPTVAQSALTSNSLIARKSLTADATARAWKAYADDRTLYLFIATGDIASTYLAWMFGDFYSLVLGDGYRTALIARGTENSGAGGNERLDGVGTAFSTTLSAHYAARAYTGLGTSAPLSKHFDYTLGNANTFLGAGLLSYPNPGDGGVYIGPVKLHETASVSIRGRLRGFHQWGHAQAALNDGDTFSGAGDYAGRTFEIVRNSGNGGTYLVETSDTWDTSS